MKYLVKWQGFSKAQSTWEPFDHLISVISTVREYDLLQSRQICYGSILKRTVKEIITLNSESGEKEVEKQLASQNIEKTSCKEIFEEKISKTKSKSEKEKSNGNINGKSSPLVSQKAKINEKKIKKNEKIEGIFGVHTPSCILKHKVGMFENSGGKIENVFYKVEWEKDGKGRKPKSEYFTIEDLKQYCPLLLIEYFEKNAILLDNNSKKSN